MGQKVVNFVIQNAYFPLRTQQGGEVRGKTDNVRGDRCHLGHN